MWRSVPSLACALTPGPAQAASGRRLLILGSSTMAGWFGGMLQRAFEDSGFGVRRSPAERLEPHAPRTFSTGSRKRAGSTTSFAPTAALVMFAANDAQALFTGSRPKWIQFHDDAWREGLSTTRRRASWTQWPPRGEPVIWVGAPIMRQNEATREDEVRERDLP